MARAGDPGREPLLLIEIEQDLCALTYGNSPCTAALGVTGEHKCYNTRKSCQDPVNYDNTANLKLLFGRQGDPIPPGYNVLPFLVGVKTSPNRLNVGGRPLQYGSLGKRGSVTITLQDAPHSDNLVDPYLTERTFDPLERGTFWSKWLARNPFYTGRPLRVIEGYLDEAINDPGALQNRHYVIDKVEGPDSSGRVTIRASDILRLADNDKAQAPKLSTGQLKTAITASDTTIVASNTASGDYPVSGDIRIDREIISYTNRVFDSGTGETSFAVSMGVRGAYGTEAAAHSEGATVQRCQLFEGPAYDVIRELLVDFGNIDPLFIDTAAWQAEAEKWAGGFEVSALLTEPVGVTTLVGELCEQCLLFVWWDDRAQTIQLRAVRPPLPEEVLELTEELHLLQGETEITVRPEERVTEVWIYHGLRTPVHPVNDPASYLNIRARIDPTASSPDEYGERKVYQVLSRWLTGDAQVAPLAFRILARYRDAPAYLTIGIDAKDRAAVDYATVADVTYRGFVDLQGEQEKRRYEVIRLEEVRAAEHLKAELQPSQFVNRYAYIMDDASLTYSEYTEATRPALSGFLCPPSGAGPAEDFPDGTGPYVFI